MDLRGTKERRWRETAEWSGDLGKKTAQIREGGGAKNGARWVVGGVEVQGHPHVSHLVVVHYFGRSFGQNSPVGSYGSELHPKS